MMLRGWAIVLAHALVIVTTTGCMTMTRPPSRDHARAVLSGQGAVVLLRLEGAGAALGLSSVGFRLANVEEAAQPRVVVPLLSPSAAASQHGWIFLEIDVGTHFLELVRSREAMRVADDPAGRMGVVHRGEFMPAPAFRLDVRPGDHVVYVGTLVREAGKTERGNPTPDIVRIVDESDAARDVFQHDLATVGLSNFVTRLARPYDETLPEDAMVDLSPVGLATSSVELERFDWRRRALGQWMTPAGALIGGGLSPGAGLGGAAFVLLGLAYTPIGVAGGLVAGEVAERERGPCVAALGEELAALRAQERLAARIGDAFASRSVDAPVRLAWATADPAPLDADRLRAVLLASITRTQLRDAGDGRFYVEVAARARLRRLADTAWIYDRSFVRGLPSRSGARPYESLVVEPAIPRTLSEYCGPDGRQRFRDDFSRSIDLIARRIADEIGLAGPLSGR
jgi:hypothetical protein